MVVVMPQIQMLDDEDGEMHLRHLKLYEAASEEDALNLLFLGNWNRITSAMPMNEVRAGGGRGLQGQHKSPQLASLSAA